ncbi:MAG: signal peptidase I [Candidatus Omnitrophica bacterium]|nr:signal peptidase I [Candidatus Omnitrophota bacterium]
MSKYKTWRYWRDEWVYPFVIAIILAMFIRCFIVQPFKIPSTSMYPALEIGDRIFVSKFMYGAKIPFADKRIPKLRDAQRGDIIVFVSATDSVYPGPKKEYTRLLGPVFFNKEKKRFRWYSPRFIVKRLIGLPGDKLEIKEGDVYIDGRLLDNPLIIKGLNYFNAGNYGREGKSILVPAGSYFVLGDNSANSVDSRFWGFVPEKNIVGKVFIIWWPLNRIRLMR